MASMRPLRLVGSLGCGAAVVAAAGEYHMPEEGDPHLQTWMAFGVQADIWGETLTSKVQGDLCRIASAIAEYEPVSLLVRKNEMSIAQELCSNAVTFVEAEMDDLWMRDTGPVFVREANGTAVSGVNFNFNGWGNKQQHTLDAKVVEVVAKKENVPLVKSSLVMEGGAVEVDGEGTAIITESCVLIDNRNPGVSKAQAEADLMPLLGLDKIIWLPGARGTDITDGHTDFYARFVKPGVVVAHYDPDPYSPDQKVTQQHLDILRAATDAKGRKLTVHVLNGPDYSKLRYSGDKKDFCGGYVNFYVANGAVFAPQFGDTAADAAALKILQDNFPDRKVVALNIDGIAAGGGGIHCTTQQQPAFDKEPGKPKGTSQSSDAMRSTAFALLAAVFAAQALFF